MGSRLLRRPGLALLAPTSAAFPAPDRAADAVGMLDARRGVLRAGWELAPSASDDRPDTAPARLPCFTTSDMGATCDPGGEPWLGPDRFWRRWRSASSCSFPVRGDASAVSPVPLAAARGERGEFAPRRPAVPVSMSMWVRRRCRRFRRISSWFAAARRGVWARRSTARRDLDDAKASPAASG